MSHRPADSPPRLINHGWTIVRVFFFIFAGTMVVPLLAMLIAQRVGGGSDALVVAAIIAIPVALAMLMSALLSIPVARRIDRIYRDFAQGRALLTFTYPPEIWRPWAERQGRQYLRSSWVVFALIFGPLLGLGLLIGFLAPMPSPWQLLAPLIIVGSVGVSALIFHLAMLAARASRVRRLLKMPLAFVCADAAFCGGSVQFWGTALRGLRGVEMVSPRQPGEMPELRFVIGMTSGVQGLGRAADIALIAAGRAAPTLGNMQFVLTIPVPTGAEDDARKLIHRIEQGDVPPASASANAADATPSIAPRARGLRCMGMGALALVAGLVLCVLATSVDPRPPGSSAEPGGLVVLLSLLGLGSLLAAVILVVTGAIRLLKRRDGR